MTKKQKYILFVKTGFLKYAPIERTFSSYLEALNFFNKHREMWGAGPKDYIIKSTAELERETELREWKRQQRKKMFQAFKTLAKKTNELASKLSNPSNTPYHSSPTKLTIPVIRYGVTYSTIHKQPIITVPTIKPKTVTLYPPRTKPSKEEEEVEDGLGEA